MCDCLEIWNRNFIKLENYPEIEIKIEILLVDD